MEKEAFPFGVRLQEFSYWVNGGRYPAALFTDHRNLLALFDDKARPLSCTRPNRDRLTRWGIAMMALRYEIFHIDGESNYLADLGSRWGNRFAAAKKRDIADTSKGLHGGPNPLMSRLLRTDEPTRLAVLKTPAPKLTDQVQKPDVNIAGFSIPAPTHLVARAWIAGEQKKYVKGKPAGLKLSEEKPGLWVNADGQVWVPDAHDELKRCLYAVAHQGLCGHRGHNVTLATLRSRFFWTDMSADVKRFRQGCLQCLKCVNGEMVPRPLASQLVAEYPGEVLMMDYIKLGLSRTGFTYVLMMVDKFSRLVEFVPTASATSLVAARAIMRWSAQRGLPAWIISDGGRHFDNTLLQDLSDIIGFEHHITLPYCPWANGSVEVVGKDLCWTLRAMCSEFETSVDEWDLVLPLAEYAINHRRRDMLGGRSSVEIMIGRAPRTPTDLALWSGTKLKDAKKLQLPAERAAKYVENLAASLERMHEAVRTEGERRQRQQALRESGKEGNLRFQVGDFVMVAAKDNQTNIKRHNKVQVK